MRRVETKVTLEQAKERLAAYRVTHGSGPHRAATLAEVIWPETHWRSGQGAGAAASRVLKRIGCQWTSTKYNWGWMI